MTNDPEALTLPDGRELRYFDTGPTAERVLVWHSGTPHTGRIIAPVQAAAPGARIISVARPGFGGSTRLVGRSVADAARDVLAVLDRLGVGEFATVGSSGGGPHALALAALAGPRALGVATFASVAPYYADDAGWFDGMADPRALRAATNGLSARAAYQETAEFDPAVFGAADWAALDGDWAELGQDAGAAAEQADGGEIDDDCAFVTGWGVDLAGIRSPVLIVQGEQDRMVPAGHATRLLRALPDATSWWLAEDGHVSALRALPRAIEWLREHGL
ncbi:alpha/beta hydrolase [Gryllotalpicola koreensis]|uniref:AB hydrolase-1 domain-containing protein n=1 Tax=Gryllotalpicola koreensis TaxID=993086 RepID=A0ABP8A6R2_9MICO